ncbi:AAA family ATPase [Xenorhabdus bovienii]|uniref:AAA family ATPase n=1 Tax=Xenorhabdus bovienii TaxID=40576 RepID=UPI00237CAFFB|nr:AAA family ATPase [Xenorhabdus bovienii]MDE1483309.1 AAA family ATPase [Xenorhabdus bovienii]MDE9433966.1 AAA family ATPase [Xenorhabdus bovienii]MDE9437661.1 AAA family ATPase [Xenorhabdus bovienii]MDE9442772.1 AAA family ATPase [Xenorhabdus bovienii]MDE9465264.1 AAA family ATPase [Xenorhabdus bovienii]
MKLTEISLKGFKSIDNVKGQTIVFGDITLLLGANGSGKSNLISFFRMLVSMTSGALQKYIGRQGVSQLLHYGSKVTESMNFSIRLEDEAAWDTYEATLSYALSDRLFFSDECVTSQKQNNATQSKYVLPRDGSESGLHSDKHTTSKKITAFLAGIKTFQFHDTSDTSHIKDRTYVDDASYLRSDAGNLAAFLKMMKDSAQYRTYYDRIVRHIRKVMPQFEDFVLDVLPGNELFVRLNWSDNYRPDHLFGPEQISDGSLRFMALTVLLLQPPELLPKVIVLDEPELGLHPEAITELAGMIKRASKNTQIVVATQSTRLVDEFDAEQLIIVERDNQTGASTFKKLKHESLSEWLQRYSLSELWEKNVLGGQP